MERSRSAHPSDGAERVLVIGVGNDERGDDGLGLTVVRRLRMSGPDHLAFHQSDSDPADLMAAWEGYESVVVVDAVSSGRTPGAIMRFDAVTAPLPEEMFPCYSTHGFGLARAIELARALGLLPPQLTVFGMEGCDFRAGQGLSPLVEKQISVLVHEIAHLAGRTTEDPDR